MSDFLNNFNSDLSNKSLEHNRLSYLYMLKIEFWEVNDFINTLKNFKPFALDVRESTPIQNALNIAVVISYSRNFKQSRGFKETDKMNTELINHFSEEEKTFHKIILDWRDQEYAHSDALPNDMQIHNGYKSYSRRVVRQLLEKEQLETLKIMVKKIRDEIENQINSLVKT